jgi:hypothetical protein
MQNEVMKQSMLLMLISPAPSIDTRIVDLLRRASRP